MQTVGSTRLVAAVRLYAYRLWVLATSLGPASVMGPEDFSLVIKLIREARLDMINAMRAELGLDSGVRPSAEINPFAGTVLEEKYAKTEINRPGIWPFS